MFSLLNIVLGHFTSKLNSHRASFNLDDLLQHLTFSTGIAAIRLQVTFLFHSFYATSRGCF